MTTPQTLFVVGHEMGHYMLGHIPKGIAFVGCLIIGVLFLVYRAVLWALARRQKGWAIRNLEDWASLPVLMLFFSLFVFLAEPVGNTFSRYQEHQADVYGLDVTCGIVPDSSQAAAEAFQVIGEIDLADPQPGAFIKFWLYSHPPLAERIAFAREYKPRPLE
jgi:Zn-dependent protease with chaperone function